MKLAKSHKSMDFTQNVSANMEHLQSGSSSLISLTFYLLQPS